MNAYRPLVSSTRDAARVKGKDWISGRTRELTHKKLYYNTAIQLYAFYKNTLTVLDGGHSRHNSIVVYYSDDGDVVISDFTTLLAVAVLVLCSVYIAVTRFTKTSKNKATTTRRFWFLHAVCWFVVSMATFAMVIVYIAEIHSLNGSSYTKKPNWSRLEGLCQGYRHTTNLLATLVFLVSIRVTIHITI